MAQSIDHERIEDEAAHWAARLDGGGMNDHDRAALAAWLEADPEHREVLARYRELSAQIDERYAAPAVVAQRRSWPRAVAILGAAAAVVILVTMFAGRSREFATQTAERHAAALADGSRVELNAQTSLAVNFTKAERRVRLTRGEALFTVAKDPARPFVVETPAGAVRVTGTVFNVRAAAATFDKLSAGERVEVTVLEGTVRVQPEHAAEKMATLTADFQAVLRAENVETHPLHAGAAQDVAAWRQGQAVFEDTRLADAIERFAAYHARRIAVDAATADLRLGGRFSLDDLDGLLDFVQRVLPVRVARVDGAVVISPAPAK